MKGYLRYTYSALILLLPATTILGQQTLFSEEAIIKGFSATTDPLFYGSGISFYDWDKDGWPDISCSISGAAPKFFHNEQGTFSEVQFGIPNLTGEAKHLLWVDFDNDGDPDIFLTRAFGPWSLYRNDGNFVFLDITSSVGLNYDLNGALAHTLGAAWSDINKDGFLDLYICNYHGPDSIVTNLAFLSHDATSFSEISVAAGIDDGFKVSFQPVFFDADMDGWPDLHVINDRYPAANSFYRNNGDLTFTDESESSGLGIIIDAMSNTPGDYDNDGDLDLYISNKVVSSPFSPGGNFLFNNDGNANFTVASEDTAVTVWVFSWGAQWIDQDLDGYLDLFVSTSMNGDLDPVFSNHFARNNTDGSFEYRSDSGMEEFVGRTYSAAVGDYDNNGSPDLALSCKSPYRNELWRNNAEGHTYIKLSLEGTVSNRDAIGSTVRCYSNGLQQLHYTTCGEAYLSQNSQHLLFGLNGVTIVDSLIISWPSGIVDHLYNLPVNQTVHLLEGSSQQPVDIANQETDRRDAFLLYDRTLHVLQPDVNQVRLYDSNGALIISSSLSSAQTLDLQGLSTGVFFVEIIHFENIKEFGKIVVFD